MAVQSINDSSSKTSRILTLGVAGAGIGAGVGFFVKPSVNSIINTSKDIFVKDINSDIKFLTKVLKNTKKNGFDILPPKTKQTLKDLGYSTDLKSIKSGIVTLIEERNTLEGGRVFKKALKRLAKNKTAPKELIDKAQETLKFKISIMQDYLELFQDGIINSMKSTASTDAKNTIKELTARTIKTNIKKGALLGASIAVGLGILSLIKPKEEYLVFKK